MICSLLFTSCADYWRRWAWRRERQDLRRRSDDRHRAQLTRGLSVDCRRGVDVVGVQQRHNQLADSLLLLNADQRDLVAGLRHLEIAESALVVEFKPRQRRLF